MAWIAWAWPLGGPGEVQKAPATLSVIGGAVIGASTPGGSLEPLTPGVLLVLDGQLLSRRIRAELLELTFPLGERRRLELVYWAPNGGEFVNPGQRILYREDTVNIFQGAIEEVDVHNVPGTPVLATRIQAIDATAILDRRRITQASVFTGQTAGAIVRGLVSAFLTSEAITTQSVQDGPILATHSVERYITVAEALRDLANLTGFNWYLDANNDLHFEPDTAEVAPFSVGTGGISPQQGSVRVTVAHERYRNRQTVRFGEDLEFAVTVDDAVEQAARRAIEGGSGIYHHVQEEGEITDAAEAQAWAEALLRRHGRLVQRVDFALRTRGLKPGQLVAVNFPAHAIDAEFLVQEVAMRDEGNQIRRYEIRALAGEHQGDESLDFWRAALAR